jgi:integrase
MNQVATFKGFAPRFIDGHARANRQKPPRRDYKNDDGQQCLTIQRSDWCGHVTVPKSGRSRRPPMTRRLASALKASRHLRSAQVFCLPDGVRHTFLSHLAMRGAPVRAIQDLAGHADLSTTQRHMHLTPSATEAAIQLVDSRARVATSVAVATCEAASPVGARG